MALPACPTTESRFLRFTPVSFGPLPPVWFEPSWFVFRGRAFLGGLVALPASSWGALWPSLLLVLGGGALRPSLLAPQLRHGLFYTLVPVSFGPFTLFFFVSCFTFGGQIIIGPRRLLYEELVGGVLLSQSTCVRGLLLQLPPPKAFVESLFLKHFEHLGWVFEFIFRKRWES